MTTNNEQQNGAKQSTSIQQEAYNALPRVNQITLDNEKLRNEINTLKYRLEEAKGNRESALRYIHLCGCSEDFARYNSEGGIPNVELRPRTGVPFLNEDAIAFINELQDDEGGYYPKLFLNALYTLSGFIEETLPLYEGEAPSTTRRRQDAYDTLTGLARLTERLVSLSKTK